VSEGLGVTVEGWDAVADQLDVEVSVVLRRTVRENDDDKESVSDQETDDECVILSVLDAENEVVNELEEATVEDAVCENESESEADVGTEREAVVLMDFVTDTLNVDEGESVTLWLTVSEILDETDLVRSSVVEPVREIVLEKSPVRLSVSV